MGTKLDLSDATAKLNHAETLLLRSVATYEDWKKSNVRIEYAKNDELLSEAWYLMIDDLPPVDFALTIGDILSNIRGALDYFAWQVYVASGGTAQDGQARNVYFPVLLPGKNWDNLVNAKLPGADPEHLAVFREAQDDRVGSPDNCLQVLDVLVNHTKHRSLTVVCASRHLSIQFVVPTQIPGTGPIFGFEPPKDRPLEPNSAIMLAFYEVVADGDETMTPIHRPPDFEMDPLPKPSVAFAISTGEWSIDLQQLVYIFSRAKQVETQLASFAK